MPQSPAPRFFVVALAATALALPAFAAEGPLLSFPLRPSPGFRAVLADSPAALPFVQAVPLARGEFVPAGEDNFFAGGQPLAVASRPMAYWPDGSVRLLLVEGAMPPQDLAEGPVVASLLPDPPPPLPRDNPVVSVAQRDGGLALIGDDGRNLGTLSPDVAWLAVNLEKAKHPDDPDWNDEHGQYNWAAPLGDLHDAPETADLPLRVRSFGVESETRAYTAYLVRGDGGGGEPGRHLEWQLRLRVHRYAPVVQWRATWLVRWDPDRFALAKAAWTFRPGEPFRSASVPGGPEGRDLAQGDALAAFLPNGSGRLAWPDGSEETLPAPDARAHQWTLETGGGFVGLAVCDLSFMGPSHVRVGQDGVEIASWSHLDGLGMDLRSTLQEDEFGVSRFDTEFDGRGTAFGLEGAFAFVQEHAGAQALARAAAERDGLWFPSPQELYRTGALIDQVPPDGAESSRAYLQGLHANVRFLMASRRHWRWYGALNYGDVRTNFARGSNPDRGLHPMRWALYGRYGWRNGSGDVQGRMLYAGLLLDDREMTLEALAHARHVADVDAQHGSFFAPAEGREGGLHRRNKHHWSGSVQMQYSHSRGLYLASWFSGSPRIADALRGIREYARRDGGGAGSAFAAQAWINRYAETLDPDDLAKARRLMDRTAEVWRERAERDDLSGLSVIYADNFRRVGDGLLTLVQFHQSTGAPEYLDAILKSTLAHELRERPDATLTAYYPYAYLLANGVPEEALGQERLAQIREHVAALMPEAAPPDGLEYEEIRDYTLQSLPPAGSPAYRESNAIGRRCRYAFAVLQAFGPE